MSNEAMLHLPAFNLNREVRNTRYLTGRSVGKFNADDIASNLKVQLAAMAQKLDAISTGTVTVNEKVQLQMLAMELRVLSKNTVMQVGNIVRGDRPRMLEADIILAGASVGSGWSTSNNFDAACNAVFGKDGASVEAFVDKAPE